jgi:hypothetical protein
MHGSALTRCTVHHQSGGGEQLLLLPFPRFQGELEFADMLGKVFISCGELRLLGGTLSFSPW